MTEFISTPDEYVELSRKYIAPSLRNLHIVSTSNQDILARKAQMVVG